MTLKGFPDWQRLSLLSDSALINNAAASAVNGASQTLGSDDNAQGWNGLHVWCDSVTGFGQIQVNKQTTGASFTNVDVYEMKDGQQLDVVVPLHGDKISSVLWTETTGAGTATCRVNAAYTNRLQVGTSPDIDGTLGDFNALVNNGVSAFEFPTFCYRGDVDLYFRLTGQPYLFLVEDFAGNAVGRRLFLQGAIASTDVQRVTLAFPSRPMRLRWTNNSGAQQTLEALLVARRSPTG